MRSKALLDSALGRAVGRDGYGFIAPNLLVCRPRRGHVVDGIAIEFQLTPGAKAPAETNLFFPKRRALSHRPGTHGKAADLVVRCSRAQLAQLLQGSKQMIRCIDAGELEINGERECLRQLAQALDNFEPMFNILEP